MARSLNQKYFGNRNIGTTGDSDNGIGGEGIASINWSNYGSWLSTAGGAAAPLAGLQLPAPSLPGGVQATWTNYFGIQAVTTGAGKTGLVVGDTYTYAGIPGSVITVASTSAANATFTVTTRGSTTTLITDLQTVNITKVTGTGSAATFQVDIFSQIVDTVINEKGSGYGGGETITVTLANSAAGTVPAGTIVLTTDTGNVGSATNQENAIVIYANTTANGSKIGDIVRQVGARRFKVKTADGTAICKLKSSAVSAVGQMTITATDSAGGTYFVTKISAHKVTVTQGTGSQFATGASVPWSFNSPVAGQTLRVENI
jgi:hypothetical protein